tara:strand:+ start:33848 stop:34225 length:378 start_codon:yes stop_codon:yes gene_type:complete
VSREVGAIHLLFGSIVESRRSLVSIDDLIDLVVTCVEHFNAGNETFLVSENDDMSTAELFRRLGLACGKAMYLLPIPVFLFKAGLNLIGKPELYQRLCETLQVDISSTVESLDWLPPYTVDEQFF